MIATLLNKRVLIHCLVLVVVVTLVAAQCGAPATPAPVPTEAPAEEAPAEEAPAEEAAPPEEAEAKQIVLIGNQRFGDKGPMDDMAAGLDQCAADYGFEIKKLESESAAEHEEDIRAMAREGYDLIMTTFPPMTEPTKGVSLEYPDTLFLGIYQFINVEGESYANIWDTEYRGQEVAYMLGSIASNLSQTKKVGYIAGAEEPSINNEINGFIEGVKATCPECSFEYAFVGSFEDPATAKEIALAMYSRGVDVIQTSAAKSQLGVIEAAKETGNLVIGDVADNVDMYPEGFVGYMGVSFSANVIEACKLLAEGNYPAGEHGHMDLSNGGYFVPWDAIERFGQNSPDYADAAAAVLEAGKDLEAKLISGEVTAEWNPETPIAFEGS
ncbi:MAG: BMP family ABC transporter substrate-binding protein [Ardenticatenia bacterium]|nr:BMP family ABC transporter substrate-binding protein [Ardenticatenia bacterium]